VCSSDLEHLGGEVLDGIASLFFLFGPSLAAEFAQRRSAMETADVCCCERLAGGEFVDFMPSVSLCASLFMAR